MAAAYAALVSLMNITNQIQNHPRLSVSVDKNQIQSLRTEVGSLLKFMESFSHGGTKEAQALETQIASVACAAEDAIESHVVDHIHHAGSISLLDLQTLIQDIDSINEKVVEFKQEHHHHLQPTYSSTLAPLTSQESKMVGFQGEAEQLIEMLVGGPRNRTIIPISGMGGSGKTTLADHVYKTPNISQRFVVRAWATISQEYSLRDVYSKLLSWESKSTFELDQETENQIGHKLYQSLIGRRYLIVLDDMWSIDVWDKMKKFFPENDNGSRIVVTTRMTSEVATKFSESLLPMRFLDEAMSWKLFCEKAFRGEDCPSKLEMIGREIVEKCKRLPLSIVLIGGLLGKSSRTQEYWNNISKDINLILSSGEEEQTLNILALSYSHLPVHLKPCFLYFGIFLEDHEIRVSELIKLWIAEGFLKENETQTNLEEVAHNYLRDLIDRNLIIVGRFGLNDKIKTCRIHDSLRDLCLKISRQEKLFLAMRVRDETPKGLENERRVVSHEMLLEDMHDPRVFHDSKSAPVTRSLMSKGGQLSFNFRLLRVLSAVDLDSPLEEVFKHVNLRYVCTTDFWRYQYLSRELPSSISLVWNLQMLTIRGCQGIVAPVEIWHMKQLRHLEFDDMVLPDPPLGDHQEDASVLENLQTLRRVMNFNLSEDVCKRIGKTKKLQITYHGLRIECEASLYRQWLDNIVLLEELESLYCCCVEVPNFDLLQNLTFPSSLQKLTLEGNSLRWDDLTIIGSLLNLKVLKLKKILFQGSEWSPVEEQFISLKFLGIYYCDDLRNWNAENSHFPVLKKLVVQGLDGLVEIPSAIGDITTLEGIDVIDCSEAVVISTIDILKQQAGNDNLSLQFRIEVSDNKKLDWLREKVEVELHDISTSNILQLGVCR